MSDILWYDPIQGQSHGGLKCAKMADFIACLFYWYACNQQTKTVNYDTPRQYLNFNWTDF